MNSRQWGWGSVPSVCVSAWTCLLLRPQIKYSSSLLLYQTSGHNRCRILWMINDIYFSLSEWYSQVLRELDSVKSTTFTEFLPFWQFVFKVKSQHILCRCKASNQAECLFSCELGSEDFVDCSTNLWKSRHARVQKMKPVNSIIPTYIGHTMNSNKANSVSSNEKHWLQIKQVG